MLQWSPLSSGTRVLVTDGPFEGLSATFVSSREFRVVLDIVLDINLGARSIMCEMDHSWIQLLQPASSDDTC